MHGYNGLVDINIYNLLYPGNPLNFFTLISKLEIGTMTGDYFLIFYEDWTKEVNYISALQIYINE